MSIQSSFYKQIALALIMRLILCSANTETNPGPKRNSKIFFCHWNVNGIAVHNFSKVSLLQVMATTHNYDFICLSETFLDSSSNSLDD